MCIISQNHKEAPRGIIQAVFSFCGKPYKINVFRDAPLVYADKPAYTRGACRQKIISVELLRVQKSLDPFCFAILTATDR